MKKYYTVTIKGNANTWEKQKVAEIIENLI